MALLIPAGVFAQDLTGYNWYFGSAQRDLRFARPGNSPILVTDQATPFGNGGSAVATDPTTGNVLFYTDGLRVYDWTNNLMAPGSALTGDPIQNQPVAICRIPGRKSQYYIFHRQAGVLRYTVVDVLRPGGAPVNTPPRGEIDFVDSLNQTIPGYPTGLSEAMAVIPHSNGTDFFLLTHQSGATPAYVIMPITATGFGTITSVAPSNSAIQTAASFSVKQVGSTTLIAVAPKETNTNVEVLTFDEATPAVTVQRVTGSGVSAMGTEAIYDTEFSSSGQYLYVSVHGFAPTVAPMILQYDLNDLTLTADTIQIPSTADQSFGLQMGPDSLIYHLYQDGANFLLGSFSGEDTVASAIAYNPSAFPGNFGGKQFPSFAPFRPQLQVSFVTDGSCQNSPIAFYPTVVPGADSLLWTFSDGQTSSSWSPVMTFGSTSVTATLTAFVNGQPTSSAPQALALTTFDTQIQVVQDTTACTCELPYSKTDPDFPPTRNNAPCNGAYFTLTATINGSGSANWTWFGPAGAMNSGSGASATLAPDSAGYYYLIAEVGACRAYAGVNIKEYAVPDQRANIWYFGNNAGLDFNPLPNDPVAMISNPVMNAPEGTSTISDRNGQVVFFTDGDKVWGPESAGFPELADDIGGDPTSTQSALIVPVPGDETLYYIFTTKEIYGTGRYILSYSLFDKKVLPNGAVVQKNITLFESSTERIAASATGWLIAHEYGNNTFRAYRITGAGLGNPVFSDIGSDHAFTSAGQGQGYMKLGPANRLAVAIQDLPPGANTIEVFDFVDSTGTVVNLRTLTLTHPGKVYGIEFSGNKLFATLSAPGGSRLYEYNFNAAGVPVEINPLSPPAPNTNPQSATLIPEELGAIQLGPDGNIYVAANGKNYLGTIIPNASPTALSQIVFNQRPLAAGTTSTLGLPNFIQSIVQPLQQPGLTASGFCLGDSTFFNGSGTDVIDEFTWFIDGVIVAQDFNLTSYSHLFDDPSEVGQHDVRLRITNRCVGVVFDQTQTFTINAPPPTPVPTVVPMCTPPLTLDANDTNTPNLTYVWSTGATTETIDVINSGDYSVTITSTVTQCVSNETITVSPAMPQVTLGPDINQCSGSVNVTLNSFIATSTHQWTEIRNGTVTPVGGNGNILNVSLATPGQVAYAVKIEDPRGIVPPNTVPCFVTDTVLFTINETPVFTTSTTAPVPCGSNTGSIQVTVTNPAAPVTMYFNGGLGVSNQISPILIPNLIGGSYTVDIENETTGCVSSASVVVIDGNFNIIDALENNVCGTRAAQILTDLPAMSPIHYTILSSSGQLMENNVAITTDLNGDFATGQLPPGTYTISIISDASQCTDGANITINAGTPIAGAALTLDVCGATPTATAAPVGANITYTWSGAAVGTSPPGVPQEVSLVGNGEVTVLIHDNSGLQCDVELTQQATLVNFTPDFTFDPCAPIPITLTAINVPAGGNYSYTWKESTSLGGPQTNFAFTQTAQAGSNLNGRFISVEVTDLSVTCADASFESPRNIVDVLGPITVAFNINPSIPCEGSQYQITATTSPASHPIDGFIWKKGTQQLPPPPAPGNVLTTIGGGAYTVTADAFGQCPTDATINVILAPTDPGDLEDEYTICPDPANPNPNTQKAILDPGDGVTSDPFTTYTAFQWYEIDENGNTSDIPGAIGQTLEVTDVGRYGVRLTSQLCEITDEAEVLLECEPVINAPNAFRPGSTVKVQGELTNEAFRLFTFFIEDSDFQVYIFNRWGEMVFQSAEREFAWNGGYDNNSSNLLPAGTYTYVVRYKSTYRPEYGVRELRGGVVLMR